MKGLMAELYRTKSPNVTPTNTTDTLTVLHVAPVVGATEGADNFPACSSPSTAELFFIWKRVIKLRGGGGGERVLLVIIVERNG